MTISRSAVSSITYNKVSKLFVSVCEEHILTVWNLDSGKDGRREKRLNTLY